MDNSIHQYHLRSALIISALEANAARHMLRARSYHPQVVEAIMFYADQRDRVTGNVKSLTYLIAVVSDSYDRYLGKAECYE